MLLTAVETQRIYQLVARQIEHMIHSGQIEPGSRLPSERDLAVQLGVSRPSVREAMIALEIAGLVEIRTGSGIYVRQEIPRKEAENSAVLGMTHEDAGPFEILAARMLIEPQIAAEAARTATKEDVADLWRVIGEMKTPPDPQTGLQLDRDFHHLVANSTKNMTLVNIVDSLWSHHFTPMHSGISTFTGLFHTEAMDFSDHSEIARQIELGSVVGARKAMRQHLEHVHKVLLKA